VEGDSIFLKWWTIREVSALAVRFDLPPEIVCRKRRPGCEVLPPAVRPMALALPTRAFRNGFFSLPRLQISYPRPAPRQRPACR
jgi:hypothetical protein